MYTNVIYESCNFYPGKETVRSPRIAGPFIWFLQLNAPGDRTVGPLHSLS